MDTPVAGATHVYTRCNIGEMMPGAFCPLTASVSGYAIDYAMQMTQVVARAQERYEKPWLQVGYFYGHMFLNMTEGTASEFGHPGQLPGAVLHVDLRPGGRRTRSPSRQSRSPQAGQHGPAHLACAVRRAGDPAPRPQIAGVPDPDQSTTRRLVLRQLESGVELYCDVTLVHVRSSSRAAVGGEHPGELLWCDRRSRTDARGGGPEPRRSGSWPGRPTSRAR